jgi:hypothetical protein
MRKVITKKHIEDERKNLNLKSNEMKAWIFFKQILFLNQFVVLFNHNKIFFQKIAYGLMLHGSITPNIGVTGPIFNDEDELI